METPKLGQYAKSAREFVTLHRFGTLSTISVERDGHPFGSIAPYDVDPQGRIIVHAAKISQHYKNIRAEPRASLLVFDRFGMFNPQAHGRATVLANFYLVPDEEYQSVFNAYDARFPRTIEKSIAHTFVFLRGEPKTIRWIGGFGEIAWIEAKNYLGLKHDPVCYAGLDILNHMNEDHELALRDLVAAHSKCSPESRYVEMVFVSSTLFRISVGTGTDREIVEINFDKTANSAEDVRKFLIEMLKQCRKN